MNQIFSMIILTVMVLTPGPLVHVLSLFALMNPLVLLENKLAMSVVYGLGFCPDRNRVNW